MRGTYVLENRKGQVVRALNWESEEAFVILRHDTRRIETRSSIKILKSKGIDFTVLHETTKEKIKKAPLKILDQGVIRFVPEVEKYALSVVPQADDVKAFPLYLKWTLGSGTAALILLMIIGHFLISNVKPEEPQVVVIETRPTEKIKIVTPHIKKSIFQPTVAQKTPPKVKHSAIAQLKKVTRTPPKHAEVSLNNVGDLAVLGQLQKSNQKSGIKLSATNTSQGVGLGGLEGSGGMQTSLYAKGLIAAPLGTGAQASGQGGYGKHGAGGGQAGFGKMSLVGSSTAYFQPVQSDAVIEGGLDSAQIAEVIQRHLGQIRNCYEQGLQSAPGLNGRIAIKFAINGSGKVSAADVTSSSLHSENIESCIVSHLKTWPFPKPRGGVIVKVNYPFVLKRISQG